MNFKINVQARPATRRFPLKWTHRVAMTLGLALTCLLPALRADDDAHRTCSNATLKGDYGALVSGIRGIGPGVTEMFVGTSVRTYDGDGGFIETSVNEHGAVTGNQSGQATGTYQVNADCSGTSTINLPAPFPTIVSSFVIVHDGKEVKEAVMSPAANIVTAVLTKQ